MDWIEKIFGISPDGGDGSFEIAVVLIACIVLSAIIIGTVPRARDAVVRRFVDISARLRS